MGHNLSGPTHLLSTRFDVVVPSLLINIVSNASLQPCDRSDGLYLLHTNKDFRSIGH